MKCKFYFRFFAIFSIILLCCSSVVKGFQNDTFYIIRLGDYIVHYGIDLVDHWCFVSNLPYTYPHWLFDVFVYLIYANFGYFGVYVSTIILFIFLIIVIYIIHLKMHRNEFLAFLISLVSIPCLYEFATARSQLVTVILFLLEIFFIEKLISNGNKKYIFFLVLDSLLIANIHATTWLFYFVLFLPFIVSHIIYLISTTYFFQNNFKTNSFKIIIEKVSYFKELIFSFILSFLMGVFTPSKVCYTYVFKIMLGDSQDYIIEHSPLVLIEHPAFVLGIMVLLLILIFTRSKISLKELFMIGGITLMCLFSIRHLIFFYTIVFLYISIISVRYLVDKNDFTLDIIGDLIVKKRVVYVLLFVIIILGSYVKFSKNFNVDYVSKQDYPVDAVLFIKDNLDVDKMRLYNEYAIGSYLIFQDISVFIDSRCDLYLKEFNHLSDSIFDDDMEIEIRYKYKKYFEKYDISHVLLSRKNFLYQILLYDTDYDMIYKDDNFVLFERTF